MHKFTIDELKQVIWHCEEGLKNCPPNQHKYAQRRWQDELAMATQLLELMTGVSE